MGIFSIRKAQPKPARQPAELGNYPGRIGRIGTEDINKAVQTLERYKAGKANLDNKIVENEKWFKRQHWDYIRKSKSNENDPEPASAWLFNSLANKHADAMDNYPRPNVLPRERDDRDSANVISDILPVVMEQNRFEKTYSDVQWYKLKTGTGVYLIVWDPDKLNGIGDIDIRRVDLLNLVWEPGKMDIQKSRNLFHVEFVDRDIIEENWPFMKDKITRSAVQMKEYAYDETIDMTDKEAVVDWYYKKYVNGRTVLHYCKFCNDQVLYASENDPEYTQRGFYDHGKYPVVFDVMFIEEGMPTGFGYLDVCKSPQIYIDKLDQAILKNAMVGAKRRWWVRQDGKVNEEEYADNSKDFVHYSGSGRPEDSIFPIQQPPLNLVYQRIRLDKVEELKQTSGNRDFAQGGTAGGVTAASAIAILNEAGSKLSRDSIRGSYHAYSEVCYLIIELMRQFYTEDRWFRVTDDKGKMDFRAFSGKTIAGAPEAGDYGITTAGRVPIFDVKVSAERGSPFSTIAQNQRAKELYGMGFFRPDMADQSLVALEMMNFEGIEKVRDYVTQNGSLFKKMQQIVPVVLAISQELDGIKGSSDTQKIIEMLGVTKEALKKAKKAQPQNDAAAQRMSMARSTTAGADRAKAAKNAVPRQQG